MAARQLNEFMRHLRRVLDRHDAGGITDGELVKRYVQQRDETAFEALLRRHGPMVFGVCRRVLHNQHDAEDAFQATFLIFVSKASSLRSPGMIGNWLYGVAYRTALHAREAAGKRRAKEAEMPAKSRIAEDIWADLRPALDLELERLPDKYRSVIVLCDLEGKTRKEAARHLGRTEGTVASRLARGRVLLAKRLARHGLMLSGGALAAVLFKAQTASASVPTCVVYSTIKAATLIAAGKATAGVISAKVATLTEGVLKAMLLTKLKTGMAVLVVLSVIAIPATALTYHAMARDEPKQSQDVQSQPPLKNRKALEEDLRQLRAEVRRLRTDIEELKKRSQPQVPDAQASKPRLVIKVYPVAGLTDTGAQVKNGEEALSLTRVITRTIEPESWDELGGPGSIIYLQKVGSLIIRQTPEVHKQVQDFLDVLRETKRDQEKAERDKNGN
jgi:RNA polymerase sigma factor (sigma-70 family)